ncbi:MAG: metallophosphoesterase [Treponema sp.]|nr:metallophosphoesterase [Treponema sp.]
MSGKKLLVFSDSHGSVSALKAVFKWANDRIPPNDTICATACLGDGLSDLRRAADETGFYSDWKIVCGNNDYGIQAPESVIFDFADRRFFMCHGHRHGLYSGYYKLLAAAENKEADAVLFGHSHIPYFSDEDGIALINPGSIGQPRSRIGATFAVIECIENKPLIAQFYGIGEKYKIKQIKLK